MAIDKRIEFKNFILRIMQSRTVNSRSLEIEIKPYGALLTFGDEQYRSVDEMFANLTSDEAVERFLKNSRQHNNQYAQYALYYNCTLTSAIEQRDYPMTLKDCVAEFVSASGRVPDKHEIAEMRPDSQEAVDDERKSFVQDMNYTYGEGGW